MRAAALVWAGLSALAALHFGVLAYQERVAAHAEMLVLAVLSCAVALLWSDLGDL